MLTEADVELEEIQALVSSLSRDPDVLVLTRLPHSAGVLSDSFIKLLWKWQFAQVDMCLN